MLYGIACRRRERTRDAGSARHCRSHVSQSGRPSFHRPRSNKLRRGRHPPTDVGVRRAFHGPTDVNAGRRVAGAVGRLHNPVPRQYTRIAPRLFHCGAGFGACLGAGSTACTTTKKGNQRPLLTRRPCQADALGGSATRVEERAQRPARPASLRHKPGSFRARSASLPARTFHSPGERTVFCQTPRPYREHDRFRGRVRVCSIILVETHHP